MSLLQKLGVSTVLFLVACGSNSDDGATPGGASGTGGAASTGGSSGSTNGGTSNGGTSNGGTSNGGTSNGGASNGGASNGGTSGSGPGSGGSQNSPDGGTGGSASPDGGGSTTPGSCCEATNAKGCTDKTVQDCVCAQDPRCCSEKWNDVCVGLVSGLSCGNACPTNDCCTESPSPGCTQKSVKDCVCGKSPECCSAAWDGFCVQLVTQNVLGGTCGTCPP